MNPHWQFKKFIKVNREFLLEYAQFIDRKKRKAWKTTIISISLVSLALIIPIILQEFSYILLINFLSIYLLIGNIRRNKKFSEEKNAFLVDYEETIKRWEQMPSSHKDLSYEEILMICRKQFYEFHESEPEPIGNDKNKPT
ncbi:MULTISPECIES: hypothetical protein [unclassified Psychrobacillus]|uniref:hypothetical protein n=1 Tax=unclassified Psychrobacillus TaxID=2636677 RepID=UPI0030F654B5